MKCDIVTRTIQEMCSIKTKLPEIEANKRRTDLTEEWPKSRKYDIVWVNVIAFLYYHLAGVYGLYCLFFAKWQTIVFTIVVYLLSAMGITAGAHRLWSHRSYKAKLPLQIFLMISHCMANQHTVIHWARDHRIHHKFSDTDCDPHDASRGLFYSHIGWLLVRKSKNVIAAGKTVDLSDLLRNPVLMFQRRHANWLIITLAFVIPSLIPTLWNEGLSTAYHINMLRYIVVLNVTFMINSVSHKWGNKPYDISIKPAQSVVVGSISLGEGFHNYHHTFPQDYRTAELGNNMVNLSTRFIDFCTWIGQAYDRKSVSLEMARARALRTGDGTDLWCRKTAHS